VAFVRRGVCPGGECPFTALPDPYLNLRGYTSKGRGMKGGKGEGEGDERGRGTGEVASSLLGEWTPLVTSCPMSPSL